MALWHILAGAVLCLLTVVCPVYVQAIPYADSDIVFVENRGQVIDAAGRRRPDILYTAEAPGMKVFCRRNGLSYVLSHTDYSTSLRATNLLGIRQQRQRTTSLYRVDVEFVGGAATSVDGQQQSEDYANYYLAHCPEGITNVYGHKRIVYSNIYPNIDVVLYTREQGLKYDFIVHPGGNPSDIVLRYKGAENIEHNSDGSLSIQTPLGSVHEQRPYTYQNSKEIPCRYIVQGTEVRFTIGSYDTTASLVIDPDVLWSTYYGGSSEDWGYDVATDALDNVLVAGYTFSIDFPVDSALQTVIHDDYDDAFIIKMSGSGKRIWATYYGGSRDDIAVGIAVDDNGSVAVAGRTGSPDFPIEDAWQPERGGSFILKLTASGQRLWATCLGGLTDIANGVAVDRNGGVVVLGETWNENFPVLNAFQPKLRGGTDVFLARFSGSGTLLWSTYLGGSGAESYIAPWGCDAIAVDNTGNIVIGGTTTSTDFPLRSPWQSEMRGQSDCFIAKLRADGVPLWSTYYGGQSHDYTYSVATDRTDNVLVCGATSSPDFPVHAAYQQTLSGTQDVVVLKFTPDGKRVWSTYYGGTAREEAYGIAADTRDNVFITGWTESPDFPTVEPVQAVSGGGNDAFVAGFDRNGKRLWASYFGGNDMSWSEKGQGIATDRHGNIIMVGSTASTNLATLHAQQPRKSGTVDAFIVRFSCAAPRPATTPVGDVQLCEGDSVVISAPPGYNTYKWSNGATTASIVVHTAGEYRVVTNEDEPCNTASLPVTVSVLPRPHPRILGAPIVCEGERTVLSADAPYSQYRWERSAVVIATTSSIEISEAGIYTLTVANQHGCVGTVELPVFVNPRPVAAIEPSSNAAIVLCPGDSVVLTAIGNFASCLWSNGATTASITVRDTGSYAVVVRDDSGCLSLPAQQYIGAVDITTEPIQGPTTVCIGGEAVYTLIYQPGTDYQWSVGDGAVVSQVDATTARVRWEKAGNYTLTAERRAQHCSYTTTLSVQVADSLQPVVVGARALCIGESTELTVQGQYSAYQWTGGATTANIIADAPGLYTVVVYNEQGCSGSTTITIVAAEAARPAISGAERVCSNSTVSYSLISAGNLTDILWAVEGGSIMSGQSTPGVVVQWGNEPTGRVSVRVRDMAFVCEGTAVLPVAIGKTLQPAIVATPAVPCTGEPVELSAGQFTSYQWSTGETSATITVTADGEYSVTVVDATGCAGSTTMTVGYMMNTFMAPDTIQFGRLTEGAIVQRVRTWTNSGDRAVRLESWSVEPATPGLRVVSTPVLPAELAPGESVVLDVELTAQESTLLQSTIVLEVARPCPDHIRIPVYADISASTMLLRIPDTTAYPWQRGYRIPLYGRVIAGRSIASQILNFSVAMDASVFFPTGLSQGVITSNSIDDATGIRTLSGSIELPTVGNGDVLLTEIIGDVLLGERDTTGVVLAAEFKATTPEAGRCAAEMQSGLLELLGICREGGARFVRSASGFGVSIYPHPVSDELIALVEVVEVGECVLELYGVDGRSEVLRQWRFNAGDDSASIVRYALSSKGAGVYWLVLRTPTQTDVQPFLIVK